MNFRPAGYSSDEDEDEFNNFCFDGDHKSVNEKKEELARELYETRQQVENSAINRLYRAIIIGNLNLVINELDNGTDIECKLFNNVTPLYLAASIGNSDIVKYLLDRGANAQIDIDGSTTLMAACSCLQKSTTSQKILTILQNLIQSGANISAIDRKRKTVFMLACEQGFIKVVQFLLEFSNLESEDNQGWTALFYAVHANNLEIVKFLLQKGANVYHNDSRKNNVKYYCNLNDLHEILKIFPEDEDISPDNLIDTDYNYESMFERLKNNEMVAFKSYIPLLLYGMRCEQFISFFNQADIDLIRFLLIDNGQLEKLGIKFSFQRKQILQGLHRFHNYTWQKSSFPTYVPIDETSTTTDIFIIIINAVKLLMVMESSVNYIIKNCDTSILKKEKENLYLKQYIIMKKIKAIKSVVKLLHEKLEKIDKVSGQPDLITNNIKFKKNMLKKKLAISFAGISALFLFRYCKVRFL